MSLWENITPIILAGGLGTRLRSTISDLPKVMASVNGRPFLTYLLDQIICTGFRQVILCTGYKGDVISDTIGNVYDGLTVRYSLEDKPLGTGGALRLALPLVSTDYVMAMNGDSYVETNLAAFLSWHAGKRCKASILLVRVADTSRFGSVRINEDNLITSFEEKKDSNGSGLINSGIYLIKKNLLESIPPQSFFSLEREFFPGLVGKYLYSSPCEARFIDIGTPESYNEVQNFFSNFSKRT